MLTIYNFKEAKTYFVENILPKGKKEVNKTYQTKIADGADLDSDEEGYAIEWNL